MENDTSKTEFVSLAIYKIEKTQEDMLQEIGEISSILYALQEAILKIAATLDDLVEMEIEDDE